MLKTPMYFSKCINVAVIVFIFMTCISLLVAFNPGMPSAIDLDSSWIYGLGQAVTQGLSFGRDIVFTYGPYMTIIQKFYLPQLDLMTIFGGLFLALSYSVTLCILKVHHEKTILAFLVVLVFGYLVEILLNVYSLIVALAAFKVVTRPSREYFLAVPWLIFILFFPLGLLGIIKGIYIYYTGLSNLMKERSMNIQKGFTLIELVIVIVIIGILSAVVVPKYLDLTSQANLAAAQGVAGALSSSSTINYAVRQANATAGVAVTGANAVACLASNLSSLITGSVTLAATPASPNTYGVGTGAGTCAAGAMVTCLISSPGTPAQTATAYIQCTGA